MDFSSNDFSLLPALLSFVTVLELATGLVVFSCATLKVACRVGDASCSYAITPTPTATANPAANDAHRIAVGNRNAELGVWAAAGSVAAAGVASHAGLANFKPVPPSFDKKFAAEIPVRDPQIRGPVNFFRTEYGRWWLIEKTGDEHFEQQVPLSKYGHYTLYEALNLVDGKRSVADIRDFISAEYEPVNVQDVDQYFRFLESVGVVHMKKTGATSGE